MSSARDIPQALMAQKRVGGFPLMVKPVGRDNGRRCQTQPDYERAIRWAIKESPRGIALITRAGKSA